MPGISRVWYVGGVRGGAAARCAGGWLLRGLVTGFGRGGWRSAARVGAAVRGEPFWQAEGSTDCFSWVLREVGLAVGWRVRRSRTRRAEVARFLIWVRVFRTPGVAWG